MKEFYVLVMVCSESDEESEKIVFSTEGKSAEEVMNKIREDLDV